MEQSPPPTAGRHLRGATAPSPRTSAEAARDWLLARKGGEPRVEQVQPVRAVLNNEFTIEARVERHSVLNRHPDMCATALREEHAVTCWADLSHALDEDICRVKESLKARRWAYGRRWHRCGGWRLAAGGRLWPWGWKNSVFYVNIRGAGAARLDRLFEGCPCPPW